MKRVKVTGLSDYQQNLIGRFVRRMEEIDRRNRQEKLAHKKLCELLRKESQCQQH